MLTETSATIPRTRLIWFALAAPLGVAALLALARESISSSTAVLVLVVIVLAVAAAGDRVAGLVAALGAGIWFDFFLTQPYQTLTIDNPDEVEAAVLLVVIGAAATEIALWGRRQAARASREAGYLDGVLETAALAKDAAGDTTVSSAIASRIALVLGVSSCRYASKAPMDPRVPVLGSDGQVRLDSHVVDVDRDGLPTTVEVAIVPHDGSHGCFLVSSGDRVVRPSRAQRKIAVHLADQLLASTHSPTS